MKTAFNIEGIKFKANRKKDTISISIGKTEKEIKLIDLWGVVFALVKDPELKDKIMPVRKTEMMKFKKVHNVQLKKDMKAGETLQFSCIIDVPELVRAGMKNLIDEDEVINTPPIVDNKK